MNVLSQEEIHLPKHFLEGERIEDVIEDSCLNCLSSAVTLTHTQTVGFGRN